MNYKINYIFFNIALLISTFILVFLCFLTPDDLKIQHEYKSSDTSLLNIDSIGYSVSSSLQGNLKDIELISTEYIMPHENDSLFLNYDKDKGCLSNLEFYELVKDKLNVKIDLVNYDMSKFRDQYTDDILRPIIISNQENIPIGTKVFSCACKTEEGIKSFSFVVVGYANTNDHLYNNGNFCRIILYNDYKMLAKSFGIHCNYSLDFDSNIYNSLLKYSYSEGAHFDFLAKDIKTANSNSSLFDSSIVLKGIKLYSDITHDTSNYIIGKIPYSEDEILLDIQASYSFDSWYISYMESLIKRNEYFDLGFFVSDFNNNKAQITKQVKIVGFRVSENPNSNSIYLSSSLMEQINSQISYESYDSKLNSDKINLVSLSGALISKKDAFALSMSYQTLVKSPRFLYSIVFWAICELVLLTFTFYFVIINYKYSLFSVKDYKSFKQESQARKILTKNNIFRELLILIVSTSLTVALLLIIPNIGMKPTNQEITLIYIIYGSIFVIFEIIKCVILINKRKNFVKLLN